MTKEEAKQAMRNGELITHRFFQDGQYITMKHDKIITSEGRKIRYEDFYFDRQGEYWEDGYEIFAD